MQALARITHYINVSKTADQLKQTHNLSLKTLTRTQQRYVLPYLLTRLIRLSDHDLIYARHLLDKSLHCKSQFLWTSNIRNHVNRAQFSESILLYGKMHRRGVLPSGFTFSSVLNACARILAVVEGKQIHTRLFQSGFFHNKVVQTALLDMYAKCGFVSDACSVFGAIVDKDIVARTAMICCYTKNGMMDEARRLFDSMEEHNVVSWTAMVAGYTSCGDMRLARELYDQMLERNSVTWIAMISGYGKCGNVSEARRVFDGIVKPDESCWAAMVACYAQNGCAKEAIDIYESMREENVRMTEVAMVGAISACAQMGDLYLASTLANSIEEAFHGRTIYLSNALIHMYAKCGCIDQAWREFGRMKERDVISHTTMITALADHGKYQEALDLFSDMRREGIKPNQITFVGVLNACSHGGLLEEGCKHFELMIQLFGMEPLAEHLTCMVDLLGKAGQLEKAYSLITKYAHAASDAGIWGALLGACKVHGNAELGEIAAGHLSIMEPESIGNYVLLASTYASTNNWDDTTRVRGVISDRRMRKSPGCSWISSS